MLCPLKCLTCHECGSTLFVPLLCCAHSLGPYCCFQGTKTAEGDIHARSQVMMQTARFVRQEGDQLELVLRIRQGRNASFRFLKPDSHLYDYYRWLVHAEPQVSISL